MEIVLNELINGYNKLYENAKLNLMSQQEGLNEDDLNNIQIESYVLLDLIKPNIENAINNL